MSAKGTESGGAGRPIWRPFHPDVPLSPPKPIVHPPRLRAVDIKKAGRPNIKIDLYSDSSFFIAVQSPNVEEVENVPAVRLKSKLQSSILFLQVRSRRTWQPTYMHRASSYRTPQPPQSPLSLPQTYISAAPSEAHVLPSLHQNCCLSLVLRAADRYASTGCGSTAYAVETVYGGEGHLYTPDAHHALLATPVASLATPRRFTGDALACLTGDALSLH